jgi:peptidoglycan/xylan/chitin deacetylase (PgdA/CDA1 family)
MGTLRLPEGKKLAVNLGTDFDAQSIWLGAFNMPSPAMMARGEFGAKVGTPRLLDLYKRYNVKATWFTPGHTVDTFPDACARILDAGHEFGCHGYYHENPTRIARETEQRLMTMAIETYKRRLGLRPRGYRSPYWDYSDSTLDLIEQFGFDYDSSLMARDLVPYRPQRWEVHWESANVAGKASKVLEIPVSWYLDDFPALAYVGGVQRGLQDSNTIHDRFRDIFDYAYENVPNGCYAVTVHPQVIGQAHHIKWFERLIEYIRSFEGVWFATLGEICDCWVDDDEDLRLMQLPDHRGTDRPPPDSGWGPR